MSSEVFRGLMQQAHRLGAKELFWNVKLEAMTPDVPDGTWTCRAILDPPIPHIAIGRSGEEALRELVIFLERTRG